VLQIDVRLERLGQRSVTYAFDFTLAGRRIAHGTMTSVCCLIQHGQPPQSMDIPEWISQRLRSFMDKGERAAT
jgi:4-hydroxybenzoyl-CoA thioesterase/acyl-CoA thioester hydrolase